MNESIDTSLTKAIVTPSLAAVLGTISETTIDAVLESGVLRDIPIISTITGVFKAGYDIKERLFIRKIVIFLKTISETSDEDRQKFIHELSSPKQQYKFGESILLLLEQSEDMEKPKLIAQVINAYILCRIEERVTFRICSMINRCYVQDLELLRFFVNGTQGKNTPIAETLLSVGFLSNGGFDGGRIGEENSGGVIYNINEYGKLFIECTL